MRLIYTLTLSLGIARVVFAQHDQPPFTPATERIAGFDTRQNLEKNSLIKHLAFRSIGPSVSSGRVADVDVSPTDPSHFYVAYASGGLWKTENNGTSFNPLFDHEMVMTIGDIAVDWKNNIIWVGTGEVNASRSSYAGIGVYKSTDGGKTWQYMGLGESHHIGRIVLHPTNSNIAWVAVLGHLYSPNQERGIYKTTDGGKTWKKTLFVSDGAGAADLVIDPQNPNILYAATWDRSRSAWNFEESGKGSAIYKSTDGGVSWKVLNTAKSGFPSGMGAGRIGLDITKAKGKTVLYAVIDNNDRRPREAPEPFVLTKDQLKSISRDSFLHLPEYQIKEFLQNNGFPDKYTVEKIKTMIKSGEIEPATLVSYTEDANSLLFDTPVIGLEVYRSDDEGSTWKKTHKGYLEQVYFSYGYYFGQIRVSPQNPEKLYTFGVPVLRSDDGGKSWKPINGDNVHGDHHALWLDSNREGHLILGNDGGINISYDDGEHWIKCNTPAVGQFYGIAVDMAKPYRVYGGMQDNGVWMGPSNYEPSTEWHDSGQYPYKSILGGDGMQVAVDTRDNETVYTGFQFGNYFRVNTKTGRRDYITPKHDLGEAPLRWNWQAPIHLSVHNQDILYMGSNKLHRSLNQGETFEVISGDLTKGGKKGDIPYGTLTTIHESPMKFGLIYTGSDDGLVFVTKDGGGAWQQISATLPENMWISRVQASKFKESRVYVALNGYRWDNFESMLYVSEDYGSHWRRIGIRLPPEPINIVKEDSENDSLLYVGTDHGLYVSLDQGQSFMLAGKDLPAVPIHDLVIQPREKELVVGTHGRSLYVASLKELQQLNTDNRNKDLLVFDAGKTRYSSRWGQDSWFGDTNPSFKFPIYVNTTGKATFSIQTESGLVLKAFEKDLEQGLNYPDYDLSFDENVKNDYEHWLNEKRKADEKPIVLKKADNGKWYLYKGAYKVIIAKGGTTKEAKFSLD